MNSQSRKRNESQTASPLSYHGENRVHRHCSMFSISLVWCLLCFTLMPAIWAGSLASQGYDPTTLVVPPFEHSWGIHKGTRFHLFILLGSAVMFEDPQGLAAVKLRQRDDPTTETDDDEVTVYGVNSGQNNIIYNTSMYSLAVYGPKDVSHGGLSSPRGVAADTEGNVYVADMDHHRIVHLFNPGSELIYQGEIGSEGGETGQFVQPGDVALDSEGNIYVADTGNNRIQIFHREGAFIGTLGEGILDGPDAIAVIDDGERWSFHRDNAIYVVDKANSRITRFNFQGDVQNHIIGNEVGIENPFFAYLAIDYYGNLYVTDGNNHCIHKFDRSLGSITSFGRRGTGKKEFISPRGIAIWRRFGQIFVAEEQGAQYYWVGIDILHVKAAFKEEGAYAQIDYYLTERGYVTIDILDNRDETVIQVLNHKLRKIGKQVERLKVNHDSLSNTCTVRITAEPTYSSYHFFQRVVETTFLYAEQ